MSRFLSISLLREKQQDPWGFSLETEEIGVRVTSVEIGGPAHRAGLLTGDKILSVNEHPLAVDSRAWFVSMAIRFGVECRFLIERYTEELNTGRSIQRSLSTEQQNTHQTIADSTCEIESQKIDFKNDPMISNEGFGGFLKRMNLGMPLMAETTDFNPFTPILRVRAVSSEPSVHRIEDSDRYSDKQLLRLLGKRSVVAPDDTVPNFIALQREERESARARELREGKERRRERIIMTKQERERVKNLPLMEEEYTPTESILDRDPTIRNMLGWIGRPSAFADF